MAANPAGALQVSTRLGSPVRSREALSRPSGTCAGSAAATTRQLARLRRLRRRLRSVLPTAFAGQRGAARVPGALGDEEPDGLLVESGEFRELDRIEPA